jgi:hypothetical protein
MLINIGLREIRVTYQTLKFLIRWLQVRFLPRLPESQWPVAGGQLPVKPTAAAPTSLTKLRF